jgi:hypothetical protein
MLLAVLSGGGVLIVKWVLWMRSVTDKSPRCRPKWENSYFSADAEGSLGPKALRPCWVVVPGTGALADLSENFALARAEASFSLGDGGEVVGVADIGADGSGLWEAFAFGKGPEGLGGRLVDIRSGYFLAGVDSVWHLFGHLQLLYYYIDYNYWEGTTKDHRERGGKKELRPCDMWSGLRIINQKWISSIRSDRG